MVVMTQLWSLPKKLADNICVLITKVASWASELKATALCVDGVVMWAGGGGVGT
jgi:hypothetical protein